MHPAFFVVATRLRAVREGTVLVAWQRPSSSLCGWAGSSASGQSIGTLGGVVVRQHQSGFATSRCFTRVRQSAIGQSPVLVLPKGRPNQLSGLRAWHLAPERRMRRRFVVVANVAQINRAQNKELEWTRSTHLAVGPRHSIQCCTDRGTDRKILVPPPSAVAEAHPCYRAQTAPAWKASVRPFSGVGLLSEPAPPSPNIMSTVARPSRFHRHPRGSTSVIKNLLRRITMGTSKLGCARPHNNALQLTRGASEASGLRRTRRLLVPLAAERECWTGVF